MPKRSPRRRGMPLERNTVVALRPRSGASTDHRRGLYPQGKAKEEAEDRLPAAKSHATFPSVHRAY